MKLDRVTITGADDSIKPEDLLGLTAKYPFVEWGILMSRNQMGGRRFPSELWMNELYDLQQDKNVNLKISCHLCGRWVREIVAGELPVLPALFINAKRVQLNFHAEPMVFSEEFVNNMGKESIVQTIIQMDDVNDQILQSILDVGGNVVPLFDTSHGAGVLPNTWPLPIKDLYCGYAGGLGPDNLDEQIQKIAAVVGDAHIWIDMETKVRSKKDMQFDLEKVESCLDIASKYVTD